MSEESSLLKLFNVACQESKSEFKKLIFFELIQRYQWEKKYNGDKERLNEKKKFLNQYFENMKNEFTEGKQNKIDVINELKFYIEFLVKEEFNKHKNIDNFNSNFKNLKNSNNIVEVKNENCNFSDNNSNYIIMLNEMKELKNNQHELIENIKIFYDLKDEIYKDIDRIKIVLKQFNNQIQFLTKQIKECKDEKIKEKNIENNSYQENSIIDIKSNETIIEINSNIERIKNKIENIPSNIDIKNLNEKIERNEKSFKVSNKQIEEKLYDKIRVRQKEIVDGFSNQDKKIIMIDENFKRKMKDLDEKISRCNEHCSTVNNRINELSESIKKLENRDNNEEIKKISERVKKNEESIKNKTNVLYEKINNVDTHAEKLNNEIIEMKKENKQSVNDIREIQNKNKEIESSFKDIYNIVLDDNNNYKALRKQNESNAMSLSILENKINSLENNFKNYDFEKISNNVNILKNESNSIRQEYLPKYKSDTEKKFNDHETKFLAKIGDVYKAINRYSQKVDDISRKFDEKIRNGENIGNGDFDKIDFKKEVKHEILTDVGKAQENHWKKINEIFQNLMDKINNKQKALSNEITILQKKSNDIPPSLHQYIEGEVNKLKALISATTTIPIIRNDPNYVSLQTFLSEILEKHSKKFEQTWKNEFYKCVEMLNKNINSSL